MKWWQMPDPVREKLSALLKTISQLKINIRLSKYIAKYLLFLIQTIGASGN